jgi:hypothetical protein
MMMTRATVWIKRGDKERFLYHHCDGYMLDEELDPILKELEPEEWTVDDVAEEILEKYEDYSRHKVDGVGWDSEYVYKIDVDKRTLEKFECGINDTDNGDRKEEKTQQKYLIETYRYDLQQDNVNEGCPSTIQEEHENTREKFEKIERFAHDVKNFIDFLGKTHNFDEEDMKTAMDLIYHLSKNK